ncbi:TPA: hypothetical protein ACRT9U_001753, partial [Staphylococcus aureus]
KDQTKSSDKDNHKKPTSADKDKEASQDKQSKDQTKSSDKDNHKKPTSADKDQKANDKHQS